MVAEAPVRFPLRLVKELITGALVRKGGVAAVILGDVGWLVAGKSWFEVENGSLVGSAETVVVDRSHHRVLAGETVLTGPEG